MHGLTGAVSLTADDEFLYWSGWTKKLHRLSKKGGGAALLASDAEGIQLGLAADGNNVYFTAGLRGDVRSAPRVGGGTAITSAGAFVCISIKTVARSSGTKPRSTPRAIAPRPRAEGTPSPIVSLLFGGVRAVRR